MQSSKLFTAKRSRFLFSRLHVINGRTGTVQKISTTPVAANDLFIARKPALLVGRRLFFGAHLNGKNKIPHRSSAAADNKNGSNGDKGGNENGGNGNTKDSEGKSRPFWKRLPWKKIIPLIPGIPKLMQLSWQSGYWLASKLTKNPKVTTGPIPRMILEKPDHIAVAYPINGVPRDAFSLKMDKNRVLRVFNEHPHCGLHYRMSYQLPPHINYETAKITLKEFDGDLEVHFTDFAPKDFDIENPK